MVTIEELEKERDEIAASISSNEASLKPVVVLMNEIEKKIGKLQSKLHDVNWKMKCMKAGIRVFNEMLLRGGDLLNPIGILRCVGVFNNSLTKREYIEIIKMNYDKPELDASMLEWVDAVWDSVTKFLEDSHLKKSADGERIEMISASEAFPNLGKKNEMKE